MRRLSRACSPRTALRAVAHFQTHTVNTQVNVRFADKTVLVQGASRGLGLEFVRQLLPVPGIKVIATCRQPDAAAELRQLQASHDDSLHVLRLNVEEDDSIEAAAQEVAQIATHVDMLLNVSGVLHIPDVLSPETSLAKVTSANLEKSFRVNAFGPTLVTKAVAQLLTKSKASAEQPALVANLSARVGSINDNRLGGWYSYRASKAALNMLTKTMALEFERKRSNVACLLLHPGTCDTDLTRPFQKNVPPEKLFTRERGVKQMLGILANATMADTGKYVAWDGQEIQW